MLRVNVLLNWPGDGGQTHESADYAELTEAEEAMTRAETTAKRYAHRGRWDIWIEDLAGEASADLDAAANHVVQIANDQGDG